MLSVCLALGIIFIAVAIIMAVVWFWPESAPRLSRKGKSAGNVRRRNVQNPIDLMPYMMDDDITINLDAFCDPDLAVPREKLTRELPSLDSVLLDCDEDDREDTLLPFEAKKSMPQLTLASLLEVQQSEERSETGIMPVRPKILGDTACDLGVRYFEYLLRHHVVPRGARHLTSESNIVVAENALKSLHQSATLSHGAIAQRIGEKAVCLFEPLESAVQNIDKALELISEVLADKTIFIVLANTDNADPDKLSHLSPVCQRYHIPRNCIYIEQPDGSFINYIEDMNDFVPSRLDPMRIPQNFFSGMLDYAHQAYDEGDHEAVLRTIAPLLPALSERALYYNNFPKILLAQALNLMGMTYREIDRDNDAIACFDQSLTLLRKIEDYEAIKSVMANLGITLAISRPVTQPKIELAIRHLNEVTQLNPRDDEAWLYLANSYLELYRITNAQSLLRRALRAYDKAYDLAPTDEIASCMDALQRQIGGGRRPKNSLSSMAVIKGTDNRHYPTESAK